MARAEGYNVSILIVADDCSQTPEVGSTAGEESEQSAGIGGRGIAGTVLVHKICGAAAAEGLDLEEVRLFFLISFRNDSSYL